MFYIFFLVFLSALYFFLSRKKSSSRIISRECGFRVVVAHGSITRVFFWYCAHWASQQNLMHEHYTFIEEEGDSDRCPCLCCFFLTGQDPNQNHRLRIRKILRPGVWVLFYAVPTAKVKIGPVKTAGNLPTLVWFVFFCKVHRVRVSFPPWSSKVA